ncbi:hypothetical protein GGI15_001116 [Coemansia interrupta]|uniref:GRAM domain-containing protein n=1 Tax=Coemansia interrupta TaxID=1126814 RepID=A0A9W8HIN7_9FUNG|nr:hypothetical protein GGI15_001116 [Coemansia interrupta]
MLHAVSERTFRSGERDSSNNSSERRRRLSRSSRGSLGALFGRLSHTSLPQPDVYSDGAANASIPLFDTDASVSTASSNESDKLIAKDTVESGDGEQRDKVLPAPSDVPEIQKMPAAFERTTTFTAKYLAEPAPGMWEGGNTLRKSVRFNEQQQLQSGDQSPRPNMPLEPDECADTRMPWLIEQMGMGERPFSSLFNDEGSGMGEGGGDGGRNGNRNRTGGNNNDNDDDDGNNDGSPPDRKHGYNKARHERKRKRKHAFEVLKNRVTEARIGIPLDPPTPTIEAFRRPDGTADYVGYGCSLVKHFADTRLQHKLDYRHDSGDPCKLDKFLITLQRLVEVSAPYQRFLVWLYKLARWDNPRQSLWWCAVYFFLLYMGMMAAFMWMVPVFVIAYYRLRPHHAHNWLAFDRPGTSIIPNKIMQDASSGTIGKGLVANRMWDLWRETLGAHVHIYLADLADWMERAKNGATWQRPWASRVVMLVFTGMSVFVYMVPASVLQRLFGICVGVQFFFLAPLQLRYERYRRMLWVVDCLLWHCPTDVELAMDTLYTQSLRRTNSHGHHGHHGHGHSRTDSHDSKASSAYRSHDDDEGVEKECGQTVARGPREYVRRMYNDMMYAYNPLTKRRYPPVMILQTASSASLDRLGDESDGSTDINAVHEALSAGRRLGKKILLGAADAAYEDDRYTGIGGNTADDTKSYHLPSMMGPSEEQEWMQKAGLFKPISRTYSVDSLVSMDKGRVLERPTSLRHTRRVSDEDVPSILLDDRDKVSRTVVSGSGSSGSDTSAKSRGDDTRGQGRSLLGRAKDQISSKLKRTLIHHSKTSPDPEVPGRPNGPGGPPVLRHSVAIPPSDMPSAGERRTKSMQVLSGEAMDGSADSDSGAAGKTAASNLNDPGTVYSLGSKLAGDLTRQEPRNSPDGGASLNSNTASVGSSSLELTHEANELASLRNKDARSTDNVVDLKSLYAFRCVHQGKYGTLFVTADRFVFRRSRIMGGRRSSVSSYLLSNVVAIRKSTGHFGKSHGIQMLLNDGKPYHFYGLPKRDDVFGYLLVRCGNNHAY